MNEGTIGAKVPQLPFPDTVKALLAKFDAKRVDLIPTINVSGAESGECFYNVTSLVRQYGGNVAFGWAIWHYDKICAKAEHHAVWERAPGEFCDPTPREDRISAIIFASDPSATWQGERCPARRSIFVAEPDSAIAAQVVALEEEREYLIERRFTIERKVEDLVTLVHRAK